MPMLSYDEQNEAEEATREVERRIQRVLLDFQEEVGKRIDLVQVDTRHFANCSVEIFLTEMPVGQIKTAYISLMATAAALATAPKENPTTSEDLAYFREVMEQGADAIAEVLEQLGIALPSPSR